MSQENNIEQISSYPSPIDKLLTYREMQTGEVGDWPNYLELEFGPEHVPDLIRLATDTALRWREENGPEPWGPLHAWRTLGQLRAQEAIEPLVSLFNDVEDEWAAEELPEVFSMIGPASIPALTNFLGEKDHDDYARLAAANSLQKIAETFPERRDEVVAILTKELEKFNENSQTVNSFILSDLMDLNAVEAAPVIERAFAADSIDENITGDLEDVQISLGLREKRDTPPKRYNAFPGAEKMLELIDRQGQPSKAPRPMSLPEDVPGFRTPKPKAVDSKAKKARRKMEKASRKKNRKK
jgi:HEAT repeat protein